MKLKLMLLVAVSFLNIHQFCVAQYIGVRARYTETRLVDNSPLPPSRENRLVLTFYEVDGAGFYTPISLNNETIWIYKDGQQYGSEMGGVLDSAGNNYPGYSTTAPRVVSYHSSFCVNCFDCDPNLATAYLVNGHELDCGFIRVSYWETHPDTGEDKEYFPAPNILLTYYTWPSPYYYMNYNFSFPLIASGTNNFYTFSCYTGTQQWAIRGVLPQDTSSYILPVKFDNVRATVNHSKHAEVSWSNLTESNIQSYIIERAKDGNGFQNIGTVLPKLNNGDRADYVFVDSTVTSTSKFLYRIKAVETSGDFLFSKVLLIKFGGDKNSSLTIYPNPTSDRRISIHLTNAQAGKYAIVLVTVAAQEQILQEFHHTGGSFTRIVAFDNLPAGAYFIMVKGADKALSSKLLLRN